MYLFEGWPAVSSTISAIEEDRKALLSLCPQITEADWAKASGCPGWSVQDLVSHMACSFWLAVDPGKLPDPHGLPAERAADLYVESRRSMTPEEVVADYESVSLRGLELLSALEDQDVEVPLGDVGTYSAAVIPNAFAFEAYVHIRYDLFPPNGPLRGRPPASDELRLAPTLEWIEVALPQQNADVMERMNGAVEMRLEGPCGRKLRIGGGDVGARITSDSEAFVRWVTQRGSWEDLGVTADGDPSDLELMRQLTVF